jgi:hypothetical protein
MSIEIIGMVGTQDVSESRGSAGGPAIDVGPRSWWHRD